MKINTLLNDNVVRLEIKKEIKDFLEFNEKDDIFYRNLWDTMKVMLRCKFIALRTPESSKAKRNKHTQE